MEQAGACWSAKTYVLGFFDGAEWIRRRFKKQIARRSGRCARNLEDADVADEDAALRSSLRGVENRIDRLDFASAKERALPRGRIATSCTPISRCPENGFPRRRTISPSLSSLAKTRGGIPSGKAQHEARVYWTP